MRSFVLPADGRVRSRVAATALAGALSLSLLGPWLNPLPASAAPVTEQKQVAGELSRPDSLSASVTARSTGERVEDLSQRTESSRVFANPDSTWTLDAYTAPQFTQAPDGSWARINRDLRFGPQGVAPVNGGTGIVLSAGDTPAAGPADLAKVTGKDSKGKPASLTLGWEGGLPKPVLDGPTAVYRDAAKAVAAGKPALKGTPTPIAGDKGCICHLYLL